MDERKLAERYPPNRYTTPAPKAEPPKARRAPEPVVKGKVHERKKSLGEKFAETFLAPDMRSVGDYLIFDLLIPAAKKTFYELITGTSSMMLFGEKGRGRRDRGAYTRYDRCYDDRAPWRSSDTRVDYDRRPVTPAQVTQLEFEEPEDAEEVLKGLEAQIQEYQVASVRDLYRLMDWDADYTKDRYGWYSVADATIHQYRDHWLLTLPRPVQI